MEQIKRGTVVRLKIGCLENGAGTLGMCWSEYEIVEGEQGRSIIFENGKYDGFSPSEQKKFLEVVAFEKDYAKLEMQNVMELTKSYKIGVYSPVWSKYTEYAPAKFLSWDVLKKFEGKVDDSMYETMRVLLIDLEAHVRHDELRKIALLGADRKNRREVEVSQFEAACQAHCYMRVQKIEKAQKYYGTKK